MPLQACHAVVTIRTKQETPLNCINARLSTPLPPIRAQHTGAGINAVDNLGNQYRTAMWIGNNLQRGWDSYQLLAKTPIAIEFKVFDFSNQATSLNVLTFDDSKASGKFAGLRVETPEIPAANDPMFNATPQASASQ